MPSDRIGYVLLWFIVFTFNHVLSINIKGFDDTILFKINWPGLNSEDFIEKNNLESETLDVVTHENEGYKCYLPNFNRKPLGTPETYTGPSAIKLLEPLFTQHKCSYKLDTYWAYEVCHGRFIRQYHEERESKKVKVQEFYLGRWEPAQKGLIDEDLEVHEIETRTNPIPIKKIDGMNMPYVQLNMSGGSLCDINDKPRFIRVLYVCHPEGKHDVYSIKETSICEYECIILSPLLCAHPSYKPQESGENMINCVPHEGNPKKPKSLLLAEADSLKLQEPVIEEESSKRLYAVFSIDDTNNEEHGSPAQVQVEIHPVVSVIEQETEEETAIEEQEQEEYESHKLDTSPVENFLTGKSCLNGGSGWWKFEFCYGKHVIQFHYEDNGSKTILNLGKFDLSNHLEWLQKFPHKRPKTIRKHISHFYSGGSMCDKTGKPRQTEVKLKCMDQTSLTSVTLYLEEQSTCEYTLGVESPLICKILPHADENGLISIEDLEDLMDDEYSYHSDSHDEERSTSDITDNTIANGDE